ncbi:BTB/POZ domain-containing protein 9-like protein [Leptotrombidium deliense]|uniref:BTB/POZ domain-containing protein 9-like protein n=1 Tax=Leptotrombidium deliense TaxID=299467 RepID=A0A443SQC6_9ACAR|nr:BTB/POZ domain-containing protein 9-like protein [Leptotrombidium deliense]
MFVSRLYLCEDLSDVRLIVGECSLPAHKTILAASCEFFKIYFSGESGKELSDFRLDKCNEAELKFVLKFIYTGEADITNLTDEQIIDVYTFCLFLKLSPLAEHICGFIRGLKINCLNIVKLFNIVVQYEINDLIEKCWTFIDEHFIPTTENKAFSNLSSTIIAQIIERYSAEDYYKRHRQLCKAVFEWLKHNRSANIKCLPLHLLPQEAIENVNSQSPTDAQIKRNIKDSNCFEYEKQKIEIIPKSKIMKILSKRSGETQWTAIAASNIYSFSKKGETLVFELEGAFDINYLKFQLLDNKAEDMSSFKLQVGQKLTNMETIRAFNEHEFYISVVEIACKPKQKVKFIALTSFENCKTQLHLHLNSITFSWDTKLIYDSDCLLMPDYNVAYWRPVDFLKMEQLAKSDQIVFMLRYPCHIHSLVINFKQEYQHPITVWVKHQVNRVWKNAAHGLDCNSIKKRVKVNSSLVVSFVLIEGKNVNEYVNSISS